MCNCYKNRLIKVVKSLAFVFLVYAVHTGCNEGELGLAKDFVDSSTYTALVDSVSVLVSTVKFDSVITSGKDYSLVGSIDHPLVGVQRAASVYTITPPSDFEWDEDKYHFDSLTFVFTPTGYSLGDTLKPFTFKVHQLTAELEKDDTYFYNTSRYGLEADVLGSTRIKVYPNEKEAVEIRLSDEIAHRFIDFLDENSSSASLTSLFTEEMKGFVLLTDTAEKHGIFGISTDAEATHIKLYYHKVGLEKEELSYQFELLSSSLRFTAIQQSSIDEPWQLLSSSGKRLSEYQTDGIALLQPMLGYTVRIDFPTLNNLLEIKQQGRIVQASLVVRPLTGYLSMHKMPSTLYLQQISKVNVLGDPLYDSSGEAVKAQLQKDVLYNEYTSYTFDITSYLNYRLLETIVDTNTGLALTMASSADNAMDYLVIGGHYNSSFKTELLLYYYYYDAQE